MKKLIMKEIKLTASALTWLFIAFSAMTLIPGYPILVGAFFVTLGIFYSFQFGREFNDTLYTALLPVEKRDVVRAKYAFSLLVELAAFAISAGLTVLRMTALRDVAAYAENPLMNANLAYLGYILIVFAAFNILFLGGFFRTAYYVGRPFIVYAIVCFLLIGVGETLHHVPGLTVLNAAGTEGIGLQCAVMGAGAAVFIAGTLLSMKKAEKRFEKLDL